MSDTKDIANRRVSGRVEEVIQGWWRGTESKFKVCKTLDVGMDGALLVFDSQLPVGEKLELHLDMEADWSVHFLAEVLWQRPIFFGTQQLTAVTYKFKRNGDRSMFGLWMQQKMSADREGLENHLAPIKLSETKKDTGSSIQPAPQVQLVESPWRKTLSHLTAKIPWIDSEALPNERRKECRGQVGLSLRCESGEESLAAELLNVSMSGLGIFIPSPSDSDRRNRFLALIGGSKFSVGEKLEIVARDNTLLLGGVRCSTEVKWTHRAALLGQSDMDGVVLGLRFTTSPKVTKRTFVWDLLRRIDYNPRQVRSELRFPKRLPIVVETGNGDRVTGFTQDLSAGGTSVILPVFYDTPCNATIHFDLGEGSDTVHKLSFSSRLLRHSVDNLHRNCYAVAFRKGQTREALELSRWLSKQLRVQDLDELIPVSDNATKNEQA